MDIIKTLAKDLQITEKQAKNTVSLIEEGNTIPFIARYRKELTGSLTDEVLRKFDERYRYLTSLMARKEEISKLIEEQGALTAELTEKIENAMILSELEDIYRPYRPKRKTRASVAKERGLEPLALKILLQNDKSGDVLGIASEYINPEKEVITAEDALSGAMDIIAEIISDNADYRKHIRFCTQKHGLVVSKKSKEEDSVYSMYYDFTESVKTIANHRILALDRGEREEYLKVSIKIEEDIILDYLKNEILKSSIYNEVIINTIEDSYKRLIAPSIEREIRSSLTERAEAGAIEVFGDNLKHLLMQPPIKNKTVLGIDPGYRTGCKIAVCDDTGKVLKTGVIFCTLDNHDKEKSAKIVKSLIEEYSVDIISIGNGTASGETEKFVSEIIAELKGEISYIIANEAGASVYSASKLGSEEFPDFTVEQRSAASIARRIQDPLSELVKIEPESIGVGQYQHDVNAKLLKETLSGVVEDCVNGVGVDLNTASWPLLSYVAGISKPVAKNIVKYREENGKFSSRKELLKVDKLGPKAFQQCAGFLKIPDAENILDATSVHPESYEIAKALISEADILTEEIRNSALVEEKIKTVDIEKFLLAHGVGKPTLTDIIDSLLKPDRDIRDKMPKPILKTEILTMESLYEGMVLTGTVRNVTDFGAFVDIGVHQDGLVHISEISDKFIRHPSEKLKVGDVIKVKVIGVNTDKKRISLSAKQAN
jgi:uncharacterized protein